MTKSTRVRSPFGWYGGKAYMVKHLLRLLPPHRIYVEVFGGAAWLLLAKEPSPVEVYNDLDSGLVNFMRVLRDRDAVARLLLKCAMTPYSREEYYACRDSWAATEDPVERAYRWYVVARMSFAGKFGGSWGPGVASSSRGMAAKASSWISSLRVLGQAHERIMRVQIEHQDFRRLIPRYDRPETLFYLDPPYVLETRSCAAYLHEMSLDDHRELVGILLGLQGMAVLSGYDHPVYRPLEQAGWKKRSFPAFCRATNVGKKRSPRRECVWISPSAQKARKLSTR